MRAVIIGASGGVGAAFVEALAQRDDVEAVYALSRAGVSFDSPKVTSGRIDITDDGSVADAAKAGKAEGAPDLVIVASGILSDGDGLQPEKSYRHQDMDAFQRVFGRGLWRSISYRLCRAADGPCLQRSLHVLGRFRIIV